MSRGVAVVTAHPNDPDVVVVRPPYDPKGELMTGFAPATWSPARNAYVMDITTMPALERWLRRGNVRIVDERDQPTQSRINPGNRRWCPDHGDQPCPPGVTLDDFAARNPEDGRIILDFLDTARRQARARKLTNATRHGDDREPHTIGGMTIDGHNLEEMLAEHDAYTHTRSQLCACGVPRTNCTEHPAREADTA